MDKLSYQNEEQIFIVLSSTKRRTTLVQSIEKIVCNYIQTIGFVTPVMIKPFIFELPPGVESGKTLNTELVKELQRSIAAIVLIDDLRPNVAYELGHFHGQGKPTLLVTEKDVNNFNENISDLAGVPVLYIKNYFWGLCKKQNTLEQRVIEFLDFVYKTLSTKYKVEALSLPCSKNNQIKDIINFARISPVCSDVTYYGQTIQINTWGGIIFDINKKLLPNARLKLLLRFINRTAVYSIYFRISYLTLDDNLKKIALGITSSTTTIRFEGNERLIPSTPLTENWLYINESFKDLLNYGQVLDVEEIVTLELIRARAGTYSENPKEFKGTYEIGYLEIIGYS